MPKLGSAYVNIRANLKPLKTGLASAMKMVRRAMKSIARSAIRAGKWAVIAFAGVTAAAVKLAMNAQESENLFVVSMGNMAKATRKWSDEMGKTLGLNSYEVRRYVSTFNVMLNSMGLGAEEATKMSKKLTELTYDMASFYNLKPAEAFLKLQSGISGEIEPLKRLGILVNENTIKTHALTEGIIKEKEQLTEIQKVQMRYAVILKQTSMAQGDLERTSGSLTNVIRSLWSTVKDVGIAYGTELIGVVTDIAKSMRDWLTENKETIRAWGRKVAHYIGVVWDYFVRLLHLINSGEWRKALDRMVATFLDAAKKFYKVGTAIGIAIGDGIDESLKKRHPLLWGAGKIGGISPIAQLPKITRIIEMRKQIATSPASAAGGDKAISVLERIERNTRQGKVGEF